jgi:Tfp pilus assembly protein PilF
LVYEELGLLEEAENAYRTARSIDPNHGPSVLAVDRLARRDE